MTIIITANNVPEAYAEVIWKLKVVGQQEATRNGPVLCIQEPVVLTIRNPVERVLFDPVRMANPFFHVMEFVWMMAGSNDGNWIAQFNRQILHYANFEGFLRGAYGFRWLQPYNQIAAVISGIKHDPESRQNVITIWDPLQDGPQINNKDRPCNTHIYFRIVNDRLNMTVCNRSNDAIWGMMGTNCVHFTLLQELIASAAGVAIGEYIVFTNNLHIYRKLPNYDEIMSTPVRTYQYEEGIKTFPVLTTTEDWKKLTYACRQLVEHGREMMDVGDWFEGVALPMYHGYLQRKRKEGDGSVYVDQIVADDWRTVCQQWIGLKSLPIEPDSQ